MQGTGEQGGGGAPTHRGTGALWSLEKPHLQRHVGQTRTEEVLDLM